MSAAVVSSSTPAAACGVSCVREVNRWGRTRRPNLTEREEPNARFCFSSHTGAVTCTLTLRNLE